jgi:hypothetical protein
MPRTTLEFTVPPLQLLGTSIWPAFLWAGVASLFFFGTFDPISLGEVATFKLTLSRSTGYTLGFFGFWALGIANSLSAHFLMGHIQLNAKTTPDQRTTAHQKQQ